MGGVPVERVVEVVGDWPDAVAADVSWCDHGGLDLLEFVESERIAGRTDAEIEVLVPTRWPWLSDAEIIGDTAYTYAACRPDVL